MAGPELSLRQITVTFHPEGITIPTIPIFSFSGPGIKLPEKTITVPQGIGMIVFKLDTEAGPAAPQARFQTSPVQWFHIDEPDLPVLPPEMFVVQRIGDNYLTILDFNSAPEEISHRLNIVVVYDTNTYGSDPIIINEPPG